MTIKKFNACRLGIVIVLSAAISTAITLDNYFIPIIAIALAMITLFYLRNKVDGVLADERDYALAGKASRYTISIFAVVMMIAVFVLLAMQEKNPDFANLSTLLAFLTCILMLINSLMFRFLKIKAADDKRGWKQKLKYYFPYFLLALILAGIFSMASIRMLSGEDGWICQNGAWIEHGHPDAPRPTEPCR